MLITGLSWRFIDTWSNVEFLIGKLQSGKTDAAQAIWVAYSTVRPYIFSPWVQLVLVLGGFAWIVLVALRTPIELTQLELFDPSVRPVQHYTRNGVLWGYYYFSCRVRSNQLLEGLRVELGRLAPTNISHLFPVELRSSPRGAHEVLVDIFRVVVNSLDKGPIELCAVDAPLNLDELPPEVYTGEQMKHVAISERFELTIRAFLGTASTTAQLIAEPAKRLIHFADGEKEP